jgi:hypothetical protein
MCRKYWIRRETLDIILVSEEVEAGLIMNRPDFEWYRSLFLKCMSKFKEWDIPDCCGEKWLELNDEDSRRELLEAVSAELKKSCGSAFEVNRRLLSVDGPVESVIIQTFHEFNTIYLVNRINEKIMAARLGQDHDLEKIKN